MKKKKKKEQHDTRICCFEQVNRRVQLNDKNNHDEIIITKLQMGSLVNKHQTFPTLEDL